MRTKRCWGITRALNRCGRIGDWRLFCDEHKKQPAAWLFVLIFTVLSGTASILGFFSSLSHIDGRQTNAPGNNTVRSEKSISQPALPDVYRPHHTKIIVLEFDSPGPSEYPIGAVIATNLQAAKKGHEDIEIEGLPSVIHSRGDSGFAEALSLGREHHADAVIWGYIGRSRNGPVYISFVPVTNADSLDLTREGSLYHLPLPVIQGKAFTDGLSSKMTSLTMVAVGWSRFITGDFDEAEKAFDESIRHGLASNEFIEPAYLYLYRGLARLLQLNAADAVKDFDLALAKHPSPELQSTLLATRSSLYLMLGNFAKASLSCQYLLKMSKLDLIAAQSCFHTEQLIGDLTAATLFADRVLHDAPATVNGFLQRAGFYEGACQFNNARLELEAATRLDPNDSRIAKVKAMLELHNVSPAAIQVKQSDLLSLTPLESFEWAGFYSSIGRNDLALSMTTIMINRVPSSTAYLLRGLARSSMGDHKNATDDLTRAITLAPLNPLIFKARADELSELGRFESAFRDLQDAIRLDDSDAEAHLSLAEVLFKLRRDNEGLHQIRTALERQPTYARAYKVMADRAFDAKHWSLAAENYRRAIDLYRKQIPPFRHATLLGCAPDPSALRKNIESSDLRMRANALTSLHNFSLARTELESAERLSPREPYNYSSRSEVDEAEKNFTAALGDIKTAIQLKPDSAFFHWREGCLLLETHQPEAAIKAFNEALRLNPHDRSARFQQARAYEALNNWKSAMRNYDLLLNDEPDNVGWRKARGNAFMGLQMNQEAVDEFSKVLMLLKKDNADILNSRAVAYTNIGRISDALHDLDHAIQLNPTNAVYYANKASCYEAIRQFNIAVKLLQKSLRLDSKSAVGWWGLGMDHARLGRNLYAVNDFLKALAIDPTNSLYLINLINTYMSLAKSQNVVQQRGSRWIVYGSVEKQREYFASAAKYIDQGIQLNPKLAIFYRLKADLCQYTARLSDALKFYTLAIDRQPNDGSLYKARAIVQEKLEDRLTDLSTAIRLDPEDYWSYINRAQLYRRLGNLNAALRDYTSAIGLDPKNSVAYSLRLNINKDLRDWDRAIEDLTAMINLDPSSYYFAERARVKKGKNDLLGAAADIDEAIRRRQQNIVDFEFFEEKGEILLALNRSKESDDSFEEALTWLSSHAPRSSRRGDLQRLQEKIAEIKIKHRDKREKQHL